MDNYRNIMQFQISSKRKITWIIKIRVLRKVFSKQFCFIRYAEDNTSGRLIEEVYQIYFYWEHY